MAAATLAFSGLLLPRAVHIDSAWHGPFLVMLPRQRLLVGAALRVYAFGPKPWSALLLSFPVCRGWSSPVAHRGAPSFVSLLTNLLMTPRTSSGPLPLTATPQLTFCLWSSKLRKHQIRHSRDLGALRRRRSSTGSLVLLVSLHFGPLVVAGFLPNSMWVVFSGTA